MSYLKINPDLFIGAPELKRLVDFLDEGGFRKLLLENSLSFGVTHNVKDGAFTNFLIGQGTNSGTIKNSVGVAIDNKGRLIIRSATDNIPLTDDSAWYWIKIKHTYSSIEGGVVSIDRQGNLSGVDTKFTEVLRGVPNNPVRIRFEGASLNTLEYDVLEVISDTQATLQGVFQSENNLRLVVIGSFTPDVVPLPSSKEIYQYDSCAMTLVAETVLNTPPTLIDGEEFVVARVRRIGSNITIQDKRSRNIFRTKNDFDLNTVAIPNNPLIGVEAVKFSDNNTPRDRNIVYIAWGMRSSNWTINSSTNTVTILAGLGGKYKATADFTDGDFDGWRLYTKNGKHKTIKQSSTTALQINLVLDQLDPDDFSDTTQELHIVPNCEEIEIIAESTTSNKLTQERFLFHIKEGEAKISLVTYSASCQYVLKYRYKNWKSYSEEVLIPDDGVNGYLVESNFNTAGIQQTSNRQTYTNGTITLIRATNAYTNRIAAIETGDLFGVEYLLIDTDIDQVYNFVVGTRKQHVIVTNDDDLDQSDADFGVQYQLTQNAFFNFKSIEPSFLKNGNSFFVQFRGNYDLNGNTWQIVQNFINIANPGIILYEITPDDLLQASQDNLFFKITWDGDRWVVLKLSVEVSTLLLTNRQTDNYTLVLDDRNKLVEMNSGASKNITVPPNSSVPFPIGSQVLVSQYGVGTTTIVAGVGVTLRPTNPSLANQYAGAALIKIATDEWYVFGKLA